MPVCRPVDRTTPSARPNVGFDASAPVDAERVRLEKAVGARYRIEHLLGRGQFSSVYHAVGLEIPGAVALKLLDFDAAANSELADRIEQEARAIASQAIEGVVAPLGIERHESTMVIIMPLMRAGNLAAMLQSRGALPLDEVQKLVLVLAATLDRLHRRDITHRGLSPENILFDSSGRPCITDIGVTDALLAIRGTHGTRASRAAAYAAPEQRRSQSVDGRADQYALAVIAYELLTGERRVGDELRVGIHTVPPIEVLSHTPLRKDVPLYVNAALRQALSANAANRFPTTIEFAESLAGAGPQHGRGLPTKRARLVLKRRHRIAGAIGSVVVLLTILTAVDPNTRYSARKAWNVVARTFSLPEVRLGLPKDPASYMASKTSTAPTPAPPPGTDISSSSTPEPAPPRAGESRSPASVAVTQPLTLPTDPGNPNPTIIRLGSTTPSGKSRLPDVPNGSKTVANSRATLRDAWTSIGQTLKRWFSRGASTEASDATIQVAVDRGSAVVSIDGIPRGLAPLTISVSPGHHTVSVSGALDYEASTREIDSQAGQSLSLSFRSATKP